MGGKLVSLFSHFPLHGKKTSLIISIHSYFKPDVNKTTCSTRECIGSWPRNTTNASHEIVPYLRHISPMNELKDTRKINNTDFRNYTACKYMWTIRLTVSRDTLVCAYSLTAWMMNTLDTFGRSRKLIHNGSNVKLREARQLVDTALSEVTCESCQDAIGHVIREKPRMWELDGISDTVVDRLIITVMTRPTATMTNLLSQALKMTLKKLHRW
jgi:hypothetical protein